MNEAARRRFSSIAVISVALFSLAFFWARVEILSFRVADTGAITWEIRDEDDPAPGYYRVVKVRAHAPAAQAGLRPDDRVLTDPGLGLASTDCWLFIQCYIYLPRLTPSDALFGHWFVPRKMLHAETVQVQRGKHLFFAKIEPASKTYPVRLSVTLITRLLVYSVFVILGAWVVVLRPGLMTWALFAFCLSVTPGPNIGGWEVFEPYLVPLPVWHAAHIFSWLTTNLGQALPFFVLRFPNDSSPGWRGRLMWLAAALGLAFVLVPRNIDYASFWFRLAFNLESTLFCGAVILVIYLQSRGPDRQRLKWAVIGVYVGIVSIGVALGPIPIPLYVIFGPGPRAVNIGTGLVVLSLLMPICLAYAIVRHRVIDVRFVANRALIVGALLAIFGGTFALLDLVFANYVTQSAWQIALGMAVAFIFGWAIRNLLGPLMAFVDRFFFPKHRAVMERLRELRFTLEREERVDEVQRLLTAGAAEALQLGSAAVFARVPDGGFIRQSALGWNPGTAWHLLATDPVVASIAVRRLRPFRIDDLAWDGAAVPTGAGRPALAVPLLARRRVVALALYGAHTSGAEIDPDETRLLADLCAAAAPAFDQHVTGALVMPALAAEAIGTAR